MNNHEFDLVEGQLEKRLKTFGWSILWVGLATAVDHALASVGFLNLPNFDIGGFEVNTAVVVGLVLNQISKWIHENARTLDN